MAYFLDDLAKASRRIDDFDSDLDAVRARLVEDDAGRRFLVWQGSRYWKAGVESLLEASELPSLLPRIPDDAADAIVMRCPANLDRFDNWKWRHLDARQCVAALGDLAMTLDTIHRQGLTLSGIRRAELLLDSETGRLFLATIPRLQSLSVDRESIWRDIRLFAALAYENFLEHEYPGDHRLVELLRDREAVADTGITHPGLGQLLAGCVSPYGDLAYESVDDLIEGLEQLRRELRRTLSFRVASRSTLGNYIFRQNNQDSCGHILVDTTCGSETMRLGFFCVGDGIGGIDDGQRASSLAVQTACASFLRTWNNADPRKLTRHPTAFARAIARLTSQRLAMEGNFAPDANRGGTTFTGVLIAGDRAGVCHVGDSRALLIRDGHILPLTRDHTLATILERLGDDSANDAASHRTIARFLSTNAELTWDRIDGIDEAAASHLGIDGDRRYIDGFSLRPGDILILTSDGAHDEIDDDTLRRLVRIHSRDPRSLCDAIVDSALDKIGRDNATALTILVESKGA